MKKLLFALVIASLLFPGTSQAALPDTVRGRILLQVEAAGEAWYVNPVNDQRYYLGRPADAFGIMRQLGLGATHQFISSQTIFPQRVWGRILLDVEQHGEAYYIYPVNGKKYYLGRPADAFSIMRSLGLGITNANLAKIPINTMSMTTPGGATMTRFSSTADFQAYLTKANALYTNNYLPLSSLSRNTLGPEPPMGIVEDEKSSAPTTGAPSPDRVSTTNVQVMGIDEPDIVKTNGTQLFYSPQQRYYYYRDIMMPPEGYATPNIKALTAYPPASLNVASTIEHQGTLLLADKTLLVFDYAAIYGYDVTDTAKPASRWQIDLDDNSTIVTSRLYNNAVYVITQSSVQSDTPCPIKPLIMNNAPISVSCGEIAHPLIPVPTTAIFTVWKLNPSTGAVLAKNAVTGNSYSSITYVSNNNLFLTNAQPGDFVSFVIAFLLENQTLFPDYLNNFFRELQTYDITAYEKKDKLIRAVQGYLATLPPDEETRIMNELTNRYDSYAQKNIRNYEKTIITKMSLDTLAITATNTVPGSLLNQFSLGEENNNLLVATTIGENQFMGTSGTVNDMYALDSNLNTIGALRDLGLSERIYAVRFMPGKAYLVTFRQIDPFYVIDTSNPRALTKLGELKIPGYSAYLHPVTPTQILGVGQEDWRVKLSLFDVSNPAAPTEISKYVLEEYSSDVLSDHHAFLQDDRHQLIFIPGSDAGYIFSYANNVLELKKSFTGMQAERAIYINDYMYIIGATGIKVIDENTLTIVKELSF